MHKYIGLFTIAFVSTLFAHFAYAQSTAFNGGGSIIPGADTRACDSSLVGSMRYNAATNSVQICQVSSGCPNVGDPCPDGSVYVGLSPDGNERMFMTTAAFETTGPYGGYAQIGDPRCDAGGTNSRCWMGAANTVALAALTPAQTVPRYCNDLEAHGQSDWYLPSRAELYVMAQMHDSVGSDLTGGEYYFSSSEVVDDYIWTVQIPSGHMWHEGFKGNALPARCVRKGVGAAWKTWGQ
jgi:hypothetical protein